MTGRHSASWSNWAGNVTDSAAVLSPRTQDELVEMVHSSAAAGRRIRPVGSGHSFTAVAQADDLRLDLLPGRDQPFRLADFVFGETWSEPRLKALLVRAAKQQVQARVLRIAGKRLQLAGADL